MQSQKEKEQQIKVRRKHANLEIWSERKKEKLKNPLWDK